MSRWGVGDVLGTTTFNEGVVFGTVVELVDTFGGSGYKLETEDGRFFYGDDKSLLSQCSYGGGGDPANQCDLLISAGSTSAYCAKHQVVVAEIEEHLTKLDALEDTEGMSTELETIPEPLKPASTEMHQRSARLSPNMINRAMELTVTRRVDGQEDARVFVGVLKMYEVRPIETVVRFEGLRRPIQAEVTNYSTYTVKVF